MHNSHQQHSFSHAFVYGVRNNKYNNGRTKKYKSFSSYNLKFSSHYVCTSREIRSQQSKTSTSGSCQKLLCTEIPPCFVFFFFLASRLTRQRTREFWPPFSLSTSKGNIPIFFFSPKSSINVYRANTFTALFSHSRFFHCHVVFSIFFFFFSSRPYTCV